MAEIGHLSQVTLWSVVTDNKKIVFSFNIFLNSKMNCWLQEVLNVACGPWPLAKIGHMSHVHNSVGQMYKFSQHVMGHTPS